METRTFTMCIKLNQTHICIVIYVHSYAGQETRVWEKPIIRWYICTCVCVMYVHYIRCQKKT